MRRFRTSTTHLWLLRSREIERLITWKLPNWPWCKLNTDGARKELGASSAGGLIHNHQGMWLTGFGFNIGVCSVIAAELWGLYQGLILTWQHGAWFLHVEVDSHCVVQMVNSHMESINEYTHLIRSIRDLIKRNWVITINHIYREANFAADFLTNYALELPLGLHLFFYSSSGGC